MIDNPSAVPLASCRRGWGATVVGLVVLLVLTACSADVRPNQNQSPGDSASPSGSTSPQSAVAYSACMRSHGVPNFPDPNGSGQIPKEPAAQLGISISRLDAAGRACGHLAPAGSTRRTQAEVQRWWHGMLHFARCMRGHGVRSFPDPTPYPPYPNEPTFEMPAGLQPTPHVVSMMRECQRLVPDNYVGGHIDNDNWQQVSRDMAEP